MAWTRLDASCRDRAWRGEGGIRTLGALLGHGALAKLCFQPLSHLTKKSARENMTENRRLPIDTLIRADVATALCAVRTSHREEAATVCRYLPEVANCRLPIEMIVDDQRGRSALEDS